MTPLQTANFVASCPSTLREGLRRCGWLEAGFFAVMVVALGFRLFELSERTMHYDEAIHLHFSFKLANSPGGALVLFPDSFVDVGKLPLTLDS